MRKAKGSLSIYLMVIASITLFFSCSKDNSNTNAILKFSSTTAQYNENAGTVNIEVSMSKALSADAVISYSWRSSDSTTYWGGDFDIANLGSVTMKKGDTKLNIPLQVIDDTQIDGDDVIIFTLTGVNSTAVTLGSDTEKKTTITIKDNDTVASGFGQSDLTWHLKDPLANINAVNFDLYLQYNVQYNSSGITDIGNTLDLSENDLGYETANLKTTDTDQKYFYAVNYYAGSSDVTFLFKLNGLGWSDSQGKNFISGKFKSTDAGQALFIGPFTKSGGALNFGRSAPEPVKVYWVNRLIRKK